MKGDYSHFTGVFAVTLVAGLAFVAGINALVDPLGIYRIVNLEGFNASKPAIYTRVRVFKAFEVRRVRPTTIILGSSRTHLALRCSHPALVKLRGTCYNLAFDGATTKEMFFYLVHAQTIQPLKHVILGLDSYHPSLAPASTRPGFDPLLLYSPGVSSWVRYLTADIRLLISADVLKLSVDTIFAQNAQDQKWFAPDGQRIGEIFFREVEPTFISAGPRAYFDDVDRREVENQLPVPAGNWEAQKGGGEKNSSLYYIGRIIAFCRRHNIDLRIFLTPAHAHQLEIAAAISGDTALESAKRELVNLLADDTAQHPGEPSIPLFDFSSYSSITTESLPPIGSSLEMVNYWDSSHFKSEVGDQILDVMFHEEDPAHPIPTDFGAVLNQNTLDSVFKKQRESRAKYRQSHSREIASLRSLIPSLPIIVYHRITQGQIDDEDASNLISQIDFDQQMKYLHDQGYRSLSMEEVVQYLQGVPFPRKVVAIHFDDGWKSAKAALPILSRYGLKASFWIIVGAGHDSGSPHMDWNDIIELAKLRNIDVYSHTMTHPWKPGDTLLDWLSGQVPKKGLEQVGWELSESRLELENRLSRPVPYLAWPSGIYSDRLIHLAQKAGYEALVTIDDGLNRPGGDLLRIHRTMINGTCGLDDFKAILSDGTYRNCQVRATSTGVIGSASVHP